MEGEEEVGGRVRMESSIITGQSYAPVQAFSNNQFEIPVPPSARGMLVSRPQYHVTWRTTVCDIVCTINSEKIKQDVPLPKKFKNVLGITATMPYTKEFRLADTVIEKDPTPFQKLKFRGHRKALNDELKRERLEFMDQIQTDKVRKMAVEYRAAQIIQSLFRGYRKRPFKESRPIYEMRRYRPVQPSRKEIQIELSTLAHQISLPPIRGLTLASPVKVKRSKRYGELESAAAIRLQCFGRMIIAKRRVKSKKTLKRFEDVASAIQVICKFMKFAYKVGQEEREKQIGRAKAAKVIQNMYRIWVSRHWIRKVRNLRMSHKRENDAVTRIRRSLFTKKVGLDKSSK